MSIQPTSAIAPTAAQGNPAPPQQADSNSAAITRAGDTASRESVGQKILAQVVGFENNTVSLKVPADGRLLQLQSGLPLTKGQLVLLEFSGPKGNQDITLQTTGRKLTDQILRLLLPHSGNLKAISQNLLNIQNQSTQTLPNTTNAATSQPNLASTTSTNPNIPNNTTSVTQSKGFIGLLQQITTSIIGNKTTTGLAHSNSPGSSISTNPQLPNAAALATSLANNNSKPQVTPSLLEALLPTAQFQQPSQAATLLKPGLTPPLLKLLMPMLRSQLEQAPTNANQQQTRDSQITALTQLAARVLLGALRSSGNGNDTEISRNEWITRFDQSIDSLQVELNIVREPAKEKEHGDSDAANDTKEKVKQWRVRLAFDFEELGLVTAFILLTAEQKMEVQFWSEQQNTLDKIRQFQSQFSTKLTTAITTFGIDQIEVGIFDGTPPASKQNITTQLIDETA